MGAGERQRGDLRLQRSRLPLTWGRRRVSLDDRRRDEAGVRPLALGDPGVERARVVLSWV